jgi:hypothetical protein
VASLGLPLPDALGLGDVLELADGDAVLEAEVLGDGEELAPILLAPTAWPEPPDEETEADGDGLDDPEALGVAEPEGVGVGLGTVAGAAVVVLGATSRT